MQKTGQKSVTLRISPGIQENKTTGIDQNMTSSTIFYDYLTNLQHEKFTDTYFTVIIFKILSQRNTYFTIPAFKISCSFKVPTTLSSSSTTGKAVIFLSFIICKALTAISQGLILNGLAVIAFSTPSL